MLWTMSGEKTTSPCNKFQANIFNKSKCQNCFKSRELHLLNDHDNEQVTLRLTKFGSVKVPVQPLTSLVLNS